VLFWNLNKNIQTGDEVRGVKDNRMVKTVWLFKKSGFPDGEEIRD